jgi:dTDP-4-dehydrorhamnose reductase
MRVLLTGGTGKLGQCLIPELQKRGDVEVYAPPRHIFDITQPNIVWQHLHGHNDVEAVIHCAAMTDVPKCEEQRDTAYLVNTLATSNLANYCSQLGIFFVYISTDYVFDGTVGNYSEASIPNPINFYGQTKLAGETATVLAYQLKYDQHCIIRTSLKPLGIWPYPRAFTDIYSSADYVDVIAHEIALAIRMRITGIINIATERKSIFELARRRTPTVQAMSRKEIANVTLPFDVSLDISRWQMVKKQIEERYSASRQS